MLALFARVSIIRPLWTIVPPNLEMVILILQALTGSPETLEKLYGVLGASSTFPPRGCDSPLGHANHGGFVQIS